MASFALQKFLSSSSKNRQNQQPRPPARSKNVKQRGSINRDLANRFESSEVKEAIKRREEEELRLFWERQRERQKEEEEERRILEEKRREEEERRRIEEEKRLEEEREEEERRRREEEAEVRKRERRRQLEEEERRLSELKPAQAIFERSKRARLTSTNDNNETAVRSSNRGAVEDTKNRLLRKEKRQRSKMEVEAEVRAMAQKAISKEEGEETAAEDMLMAATGVQVSLIRFFKERF